jgi:DNA-directed RNA polymerase subunit RPC12/RpoP
MLFLPTPCPDCNGLTMQVVEHEPDDSYDARCTDCGYRSLGKISPERLIAKGGIDSDQ